MSSRPTAHRTGRTHGHRRACTIRLPYQLASLGQIDSVVSDLERTRYPGWQQSPWLAGELGLELDNELTAIVSGRLQRYDNNLGLLVSQPNRTGDS